MCADRSEASTRNGEGGPAWEIAAHRWDRGAVWTAGLVNRSWTISICAQLTIWKVSWWEVSLFLACWTYFLDWKPGVWEYKLDPVSSKMRFMSTFCWHSVLFLFHRRNVWLSLIADTSHCCLYWAYKHVLECKFGLLLPSVSKWGICGT